MLIVNNFEHLPSWRRINLRLLDSVKSPSEQVRWFAVDSPHSFAFNRSNKSEFFLEQDPHKIQP